MSTYPRKFQLAQGPAPPQLNAANDKNVTKRLLFLQFLLASSRTTVINNQIDPGGPGPPQFNFCQLI